MADNEILDDERPPVRRGSYETRRYKPLWVILPLLLLGVVWRVMHWPGQAIILLSALSLLAAHGLAMLTQFRRNDWFFNLGVLLFVLAEIVYVWNYFGPNGHELALYITVPVFVLLTIWYRK